MRTFQAQPNLSCITQSKGPFLARAFHNGYGTAMVWMRIVTISSDSYFLRLSLRTDTNLLALSLEALGYEDAVSTFVGCALFKFKTSPPTSHSVSFSCSAFEKLSEPCFGAWPFQLGRGLTTRDGGHTHYWVRAYEGHVVIAFSDMCLQITTSKNQLATVSNKHTGTINILNHKESVSWARKVVLVSSISVPTIYCLVVGSEKVEIIVVRQLFKARLANGFARFTKEPHDFNHSLQPLHLCEQRDRSVLFETMLLWSLVSDCRIRRYNS